MDIAQEKAMSKLYQSVRLKIRNTLFSLLEGSDQMPEKGQGVDRYYFGHHRSASTWARKVLLEICKDIGLNWEQMSASAKGRQVIQPGAPTLYVYPNSLPRDLESIPDEALGFHLFRDPRDVLISDYYSRKWSHKITAPDKQEIRDYLKNHDEETGLIYMLDHCTYFPQIDGWKLGTKANVLEVRYEDLLASEGSAGLSADTFNEVLEHLGIKIPDAHLEQILRDSSFKTLSGGRELGQEDVKSHFRKGVAGDWKAYFARYTTLESAFYERYGHLVTAMGYEM
jgi:hypothetical protein